MTPTKGTFTTEKGSCAPSIRCPQGPSRPARFSKIYTPQLLTAGPRPFSGDAPAAPQYVRREEHSTNCSHPVSTPGQQIFQIAASASTPAGTAQLLRNGTTQRPGATGIERIPPNGAESSLPHGDLAGSLAPASSCRGWAQGAASAQKRPEQQ